ncbi:MAG: histidine phosphatase family protein [Chloroflexota bacterium]
MKLYLMRHGYAEPAGTKLDEDRTLTPQGETLIRQTGVLVANMGLTPLRMFCSPRTRARQTATLIGNAIGAQPEVREAVNFDFSIKAVRATIEEFPDEDLMFVGHEPTLSSTIEAITGAGVTVKPGSIACIDANLRRKLTGDIVWFLTPDIVMAAND